MTIPTQDDGRTMRERTEAGEAYIADDFELAELSSRALDLADAYNATTVRQEPLRQQLLTDLLGSIGEGTEIRPPLYVDYGHNISIGARCFANFGLIALDVASITRLPNRSSSAITYGSEVESSSALGSRSGPLP